MKEDHVRVTGHILVPKERLEAFKVLLGNHIALSLKDDGCLEFKVLQSDNDPTCFEVDETFSSKTAFDQHVARVKTSEWWTFTNGFRRHYDVRHG